MLSFSNKKTHEIYRNVNLPQQKLKLSMIFWKRSYLWWWLAWLTCEARSVACSWFWLTFELFLQNDFSFYFLLEFFEHAFLGEKKHLPPQKLSNCLDFKRFLNHVIAETTAVYRLLSMIFWKQSYLWWFWNLFVKSQTSPKSWRHENCDVTNLN